VKGEKGSLTRDFSEAPIGLQLENKQIIVQANWPRKREAALVGTVAAVVQKGHESHASERTDNGSLAEAEIPHPPGSAPAFRARDSRLQSPRSRTAIRRSHGRATRALHPGLQPLRPDLETLLPISFSTLWSAVDI
jgi:hypothetical protein